MDNIISDHNEPSPPPPAYPLYTAMCVSINDLGLVLHRFVRTSKPITFERSPNSYHEFTATRHITCGWTRLQEFLWTCIPHMNGSFRDYHKYIHICLQKATELISVYLLRIQELSHAIVLNRDISGMQHELLHHFVHNLSQHVDSGLTLSVLLNSFMDIKHVHRNPSHPTSHCLLHTMMF
jgi:hypothetical protein